MASPVRSARLDLLELADSTLRLAHARDTTALTRVLGADIPDEWLDIVPAEESTVELHQDLDLRPWLSRAVVLREEHVVVGEIGFHDAPDHLAVVEMGYEIVSAHRRRGIAREAALALTDWAYSTGEASTVYATIARDNTPSIALVASLGMRFDAEYEDPLNGHLVFYEGTLPLPR